MAEVQQSLGDWLKGRTVRNCQLLALALAFACSDCVWILGLPDPNDPIARVLATVPGRMGGCQAHSLTVHLRGCGVHHDPRRVHGDYAAVP